MKVQHVLGKTMVEKTKDFKKAFDIYVALSEMPVKSAIKKLQSMQQVSNDIKNVVITLFNSQSHASQYIHDNFTPSEEDYLFNSTKYQPGSILGEYQLIEKIGQGGMSQVYKAKRRGIDAQKNVAIKIFSPKSFSPQLLEHFINEQKILANLSHPNIVNMLHGDKTPDGNVYLVMELIEQALPITKYAKKHKLSVKNKIKYILQCAKTLAYSHANLIIHRDLKPDNILINDKRQLKIVDFGIAKLISNDLSGDKTTILALTPSYAAPEQINSQHISVKTDIFSLAVVALELLNQKKFLPKDRLIKSCQNDETATEATLKSLKIDKDLKNILRQALQQNPNDRYNSMQSFADDLQNYLYNKPVNATSQSFFYRLGKFSKRNKALFFTSLAFLVFLLGSLIFTLWQNQQIKIASAKAQNVKQFMLDTFEVTDPNNSQGVDISAKDLLHSSYTKLQKNATIDKENKFDMLQTLALAYGKLGQYEQAIDLFDKSLHINPNNTTSLSYKAVYLLNSGKIEALEQTLSLLNSLTNIPLNDQIRVNHVQIKLKIKKSQYQQAQQLINQTLPMVLTIDTAEQHWSLQRLQAELFTSSSQNKKAIHVLKEILASPKIDQNNTLVIGIMSDLAAVYDDVGETQKAIKQWQKVIALQKEILGNRHPNLAFSTSGLASAYRHNSELDKAFATINKAYQLSNEINGKQSLASAAILNTKALLLFDKADFNQAIKLMYQVIAVYEQKASADFLDTYVIKTNLATLLSQLGRTQESFKIIQQVYQHNLKVLGKHHYDTLASQQLMSRNLADLGRFDEAIKLGKLALKNAQHHLQSGDKNDSLFGTYFTLGKIYESNKDYKNAISNYLELIHANILDKQAFKYAILIHALAKVYDKNDDFANAQKYYQASIAAFAKIFPAYHARVLAARLRYAALLKKHGKTKAFKELKAEIHNIMQSHKVEDKKLAQMLADLDLPKK